MCLPLYPIFDLILADEPEQPRHIGFLLAVLYLPVGLRYTM